MLSIGIDYFKEFLNGALLVDNHFASEDILNNIPIVMSLIRVWNRNFLKYPSHAIIPYDYRLRNFSRYVQQLEMESLGKQPNKDSNFKNTGQIIFGGYGPTAQHSYFQLLHQGTQSVAADIIAFKEDSNSLAYAQAITQSRLLSNGTKSTLKDEERINGNVSINLFLFNQLDPYTLGYLMATWEHRTFITAAMLEINPCLASNR